MKVIAMFLFVAGGVMAVRAQGAAQQIMFGSEVEVTLSGSLLTNELYILRRSSFLCVLAALREIPTLGFPQRRRGHRGEATAKNRARDNARAAYLRALSPSSAIRFFGSSFRAALKAASASDFFPCAA